MLSLKTGSCFRLDTILAFLITESSDYFIYFKIFKQLHSRQISKDIPIGNSANGLKMKVTLTWHRTCNNLLEDNF